MEPRIQYATTKDGVSIAFATLGQGALPLLSLPSLLPELRLLWRIPEVRRLYERLAQERTLVLYDSRGRGLSERNVTTFSLDTLVLDLAAVVDHLEIERFAMNATLNAGPPAIVYAVAHPERVSRLILLNSYSRGADYWDAPRQKAFRAMREADWPTFAETMARVFFGGAEFAPLIRESMTPEVYKAFMDATRGFDVTHLLPQVRCPTLVLHAPAMAMTGLDTSSALASHIPGARLAVVEGDFGPVAEAIGEFLGPGQTPAAPTAAPSGLVTILFTDMEGSAAMTQRLGDAKAREVLREHERIVREALKSHGGSEVKTMGDGFMASFGSATKALECAIAMQRAFAERNASLPAHPVEGRAERRPPAHPSSASGRAGGGVGVTSEPIRVRIGINAGEPVAKERDLFGTAVQLARRVCDHAQPGQILVSDVVRGLAAGKGFLFADTGDVALKGFEEPVRLFEVRWRE